MWKGNTQQASNKQKFIGAERQKDRKIKGGKDDGQDSEDNQMFPMNF